MQGKPKVRGIVFIQLCRFNIQKPKTDGTEDPTGEREKRPKTGEIGMRGKAEGERKIFRLFGKDLDFWRFR